MFIINNFTIHKIPSDLQSRLDVGIKLVWSSLAVMFSGMILASVWQWIFSIEAKSLMESPLPFQVLIVGGLFTFLASLVLTLFMIPIWYDVQKRFFR